jgi:AcrR family transcriptional regulator
MSKPKPLGLQPPPIWAHPAPGTRRPKLTREQIAAHALAIADAEGFEAVSMRRIAEELGVGTMTLYYYVRTKDDLLALMDDSLMGEVLIPADELPSTWREAIGAIARSSRTVFVRHPWAMSALEGARVGPNGLRHMEQSMAAVASAPLDETGKMELISAVDDYVFGHVLRLREPWWAGGTDVQAFHAINKFISEHLASGEFPHLAALVGSGEPVAVFTRVAQSMTDEDRFEHGLEALFDGFDRRARARGSGPGAVEARKRGDGPKGVRPARMPRGGARRPRR